MPGTAPMSPQHLYRSCAFRFPCPHPNDTELVLFSLIGWDPVFLSRCGRQYLPDHSDATAQMCCNWLQFKAGKKDLHRPFFSSLTL